MTMENRRTSARIKAEPLAKRRLSEIEAEKLPVLQKRQKTVTASAETNQAVRKEPTVTLLPTKLSDSKPLPTIKEPQSSELLDSEYQSVLESGVLLASFSRSRQVWTHGTLLEKFWTKTKIPSAKKLKEMTEEERAQAKAAKGPTMTKVGPATLTIEPHAFEVTLFVVKDTTPGIKHGQLPAERQFLQYGAPHAPAPAPIYRPPIQYQNPAPLRAPQPHYQSPAPPRPIPQPSSAAPPPAAHRPPFPQQNLASASRPIPVPATTQPKARPPNQAAVTAPAPNPGPDPVIKALAQRAAGNPELKRVMKTVAQGNASQAELEYFQKHIGELTAHFAKQKEREQQKWKPPPKPPVPVSRPPPVQHHAPSVGAYPVNGIVARPPNGQYSYSAPQPPRPRIVIPPPPLHVLIQFAENGTDRYEFPRNSILEFHAGTNSVTCSFIVAKKGEDAVDKSAFDPKVEYWQPVTMKINAEPHILDMIGRVVKTADEVRSYMNDVMDRLTMAEEGSLAFRLPKDNGIVEVAS